MMEHMENLSLKIKEVRLCGDDNKSGFWGRIITSALGKEVLVPSYLTDSSAYGVALAASVSEDLFKEIEKAQGRIKLFLCTRT